MFNSAVPSRRAPDSTFPERNRLRVRDVVGPNRMPIHDFNFVRPILDATAAVAGVNRLQLCRDNKRAPLAEIRQCGMWLAYHLTRRSTHDLGREFGRHHTTVLAGIRQTTERLAAGRVDTAVYIRRIVGRIPER
jgi:hypothetical protein